MALGGNIFKEVLKSHLISSDYETDKAKSEAKINSTLAKSTSVWLNGKNGTSSKNGVHDLLGCPVCKNLMHPLIHQCPNGHTLCSSCKIEVHNLCPTSHHDLGNIRCLALEKVAKSLELPFRYESLGCSDIFPYYAKLKHEQSCGFHPYNCPYAGSECSVMGEIPTLVAHLKDEHKVDMHDVFTFNHRHVKTNPHEVENAIWMLTVFNCYGRHFCLHFEAFQLGSLGSIHNGKTNHRNRLTALELKGTDRVGLLSEVFAVLAKFQCDVVEAKVWTHNGRTASLIYVKDCTSGTSIEDSQ